jgi:hypothetical protein
MPSSSAWRQGSHTAAGIEVKLHPLCLDACCWLFVVLFRRKERDQEERRRDRDWWQLGGGCRSRDRRKIGTGGGWLGGKREERYWKLGQPVGAMDQQIAAHLTFYPSSLFFLFSSFYFLYTFIGCVLLS